MDIPDNITPEEFASVVEHLAEMEILSRVILGRLSPSMMVNNDFMLGVQIGITIATERIGDSIPEHLRKIVRDAILQQHNKGNN